MKKWQEEIAKDAAERMKSLKYALEAPSDSYIEKSHYYDIMHSDFIKIQKKGSEIKEKLNEDKMKYALDIASMKQKQDDLYEKIGSRPTEDREYMEDDAKVYPYEEIYEKEGTEDEVCKMKRKYNSLTYEISSKKSEIKKINTLLGGIEDSKIYSLPPHVASNLRF